MAIISNIAKNVGSNIKNISKSSTGAYKSVRDNSRSGSSLLGSVLSSVGTRTTPARNQGSGSSSILSGLLSGLSTRSSSGTNSYNATKNNSKSSGTILTSLFSAFGNTKSKTNVSNAISSLLSSTKARTGGSSFFSNLLGRRNSDTGTTAGSSKATTISPVNVFGGLKNLISGARGNVTEGDGTTRVNTIGLLGLSTTLGSTAQRIQDSFANWKSKLSLLPMSGNATDSANKATGQMTSLFGRFSDFSSLLSNRILGRADSAKATDTGNTQNTQYTQTSGDHLTKSGGVFYGPSGKETYYNPMKVKGNNASDPVSGLNAAVKMTGLDPSHLSVRSDGVITYDGLVCVAAPYNGGTYTNPQGGTSTYKRGDHVQTSMGEGIIVDANGGGQSIDIATAW